MQQHQQMQQQHQTSRIHNQNSVIAVNAAGNIINTSQLGNHNNNTGNNATVHLTNQDVNQQQLNVRVTMSALASQLASPPALMSNAIIQTQSLNFGAQQQTAQSSLKQQLQLNAGAVPQQIMLNAAATRSLLSQQQTQSQILRRDSMTAPSPGSDSNASNASSTSMAFSMPGLNALLATSPTTSHSGDGGPHSNLSSSSALMDRLTGGNGSQQSSPSSGSSSSHFMKSTTPLLQQQLHQISQAQSPASSISPMSSPPPPSHHQHHQQQQQMPSQTTTLNLQGINLSSLQGAIATFPHLQNVQVSCLMNNGLSRLNNLIMSLFRYKYPVLPNPFRCRSPERLERLLPLPAQQQLPPNNNSLPTTSPTLPVYLSPWPERAPPK